MTSLPLPSDITQFVQNSENKQTLAKTKSDINKFKLFLVKENEDRDIENIPPRELDIHICRFFMNIKNRQGADYEPHTLKGFQASIQRYLRSKGANVDLTKDADFYNSRSE